MLESHVLHSISTFTMSGTRATETIASLEKIHELDLHQVHV